MAENALAVRQTVNPVEWETYSNMAVTFVDTDFVPKGLRGKKEAVLAAILSGHELGIGPMQSLKHIAIVEGKPSPSAELLVALVRRAGHSINAQITPREAKVVGRRKDNGDEMEVTWTMEMAQRAGLANKHNWRNYPEAMLWNRAVSQLCRALFADVIAGMGHTPDELGATVDAEGNVIDVEPIERPSFATDAPEGDVSDAEVVAEHPCPHCGAECESVESSNEKAPKWRCTNREGCTGGNKPGFAWASWHEDPWKPGGEVEEMLASQIPAWLQSLLERADEPFLIDLAQSLAPDDVTITKLSHLYNAPDLFIEQLSEAISKAEIEQSGATQSAEGDGAGPSPEPSADPWDAVYTWAAENNVGKPVVWSHAQQIAREIGAWEEGRKVPSKSESWVRTLPHEVAEKALVSLKEWKAKADAAAAEQEGLKV